MGITKKDLKMLLQYEDEKAKAEFRKQYMKQYMKLMSENIENQNKENKQEEN